MIAAGKLNQRVTIYKPIRARSTTGSETAALALVATVWAERASLLLREATRMAGIADAHEAKFVIRYRTDVQVGHTVEHDKHRFTVVSVEEIGNREGLALLVRAI